jgi:hypothetical protein
MFFARSKAAGLGHEKSRPVNGLVAGAVGNLCALRFVFPS